MTTPTFWPSCDGVKIVGAGSKVSPMLLEKLQNFSPWRTIKEPI